MEGDIPAYASREECENESLEVKRDLIRWRPFTEATVSADCYEYLMTDCSILLKLRVWEYVWLKWVGRASSIVSGSCNLELFYLQEKIKQNG